jgi:exosome complex component RRP43
MSFGIFDSWVIFCRLELIPTFLSVRKYILADPTSFEEPLLDTSLSIVSGDDGRIITISQFGSAFVSSDDDVQRDALKECLESANIRRKQLVAQLFT